MRFHKCKRKVVFKYTTSPAITLVASLPIRNSFDKKLEVKADSISNNLSTFEQKPIWKHSAIILETWMIGPESEAVMVKGKIA